MRHRKKNNHLGRTRSHRKAMLSNMAVSLIVNKRINTTLAKAKELRKYVEPIITRSKEDTTHSRRIVFSYLKDKAAVTELFRDVSQKIGDRPGGYTRILKTGIRTGDSSDMCYIELVDYNEAMLELSEKKAKKSTRRRRGSKKTKEDSGLDKNIENQTTELETEVSDVVKESNQKEDVVSEDKSQKEEIEIIDSKRTEEEVVVENEIVSEEIKKEEEKKDTIENKSEDDEKKSEEDIEEKKKKE